MMTFIIRPILPSHTSTTFSIVFVIASLLVKVSSSLCEHYNPVRMLQANTSLVIPVITVFPLSFQKLSIRYPYDLLMGKMMGNYQ